MGQLEQQFRLAEIEVSRATNDERIIGLFRYQADVKGKKPCTIVILVEIESSLYVYEQLLDVINATAEQVRVLTIGVDADPMARFEKLVQRMNDAIANFIEREPTPVNWSRVNVFLFQLMDSQVCLTGIGRLMNIFLQKQKDGTFKSFDLLGSLEQPATINPQKVFASLICGDIASGDSLFLGTNNFEKLRGELQLTQKLSAMPPVTAALEIKQELERKHVEEDFAGIVIASVVLPVNAVEEAEPAEKSTSSIEKLKREEELTQTMLSPTIAQGKSTRNDELPMGKAANSTWMNQLGQRLKPSSPRPGKGPIKDPVTLVGLRGMNAGHVNFLTKQRKLILAAGVLVVILLIGGVAWYRQNKQATEEQQTWNTILAQATDNKNIAESDLLYGNEDHARKMISNAQVTLDGLDEKTPERKTAKAALNQDIEAVRQKLKREIRVDQPTEIGSLALGAPENSLKTVTVLGDSLYAVDAPSHAIVHIDLKAKSVNRINLPDNAGEVISAATDNNNAYFLTDTRNLFRLVPNSATSSKATLSLNKASSTESISLYGSRAYVLDPLGNMIWRYNTVGKGFGSEQAYIRQNTSNFANAVAVAVDSNVYVGFKDGRVTRYLSGAQEVWTLGNADPEMTNLNALWVDPASDRIVIADSVGKRILIFNKQTSKLVAQIVSAQFNQPNYVTVDSENKKIYVIDGNRILMVDLP